jgi:hypothetical protein
MAFNLMRDPQTTQYQVVRIASQAYTIGDAVMWDRTSDSIDVVPATSASVTTNISGVAMQTVTSSATTLLIALINPEQEWKVAATNATSANGNYIRSALTDARTVNNSTDTTGNTGVFLQTGIINSTTIIGRFLKTAGVT